VILWTASDAQAATGGVASAPFAATGVSIDTRTLQPGDLFVALKDVRDGHDFVPEAFRRGAAAALVSRPVGAGPELLVADVLAGLTALGAAGRGRAGARVVAVTGSVGKTSTKEMLRAVLAAQGSVHAAEASYNNHWGVPLTLARLPADADFAVIEIGMNHPGEIAPLARLARPHVALITTIAPAHMEAFDDIGGLEGIAREKASIFEGLEPGGIAVINADLTTTPILEAAAGTRRILRFGTGAGADVRVTDVRVAQDNIVARARIGEREILYKVASPSRHFALNAAGVIAVAEALGADPVVAACDIGLWQPPAGRGTREEVVMDIVFDENRFDLIDDAFNANPASMSAALEVLASTAPRDGVGRVGKGRRIAVLGDMLELGRLEAGLHADLARLPALAWIDRVHCVGPRMRALWEALPQDRRGEWTATAQQMAARVKGLVDAGDVVLVKGSKGSKVSLVVEAFRKLGQPLTREPRGTE
jgi:UDP-N-acetylmuramoyl-tripeptide--D-alanyl-D-alanine ligase